jgi:hypothetical protein
MEAMSQRYRKASKRSKSRILDGVCAATGYHRKCAIRRISLIEVCQAPCRSAPRKRKRLYTPETLRVVEKVWAEAGYPWAVRLKAILALWRPWIHQRYALTAAQEAQFLQISPRQRSPRSRRLNLKKIRSILGMVKTTWRCGTSMRSVSRIQSPHSSIRLA